MLYCKVLITALPEAHRTLLFKLITFLFEVAGFMETNGASIDYLTTGKKKKE